MERYLLFQNPVSTFVQEKMNEAHARADALTDEQLQDPALASTLEKIAEFKFEVATLQPERRNGKRRATKVPQNDYGRQIFVDVDIIDVTILLVVGQKVFSSHPRVAISLIHPPQ